MPKIKLFISLSCTIVVVVLLLNHFTPLKSHPAAQENTFQFSTLNFGSSSFDVAQITPKNISAIHFYYADSSSHKYNTIENLKEVLSAQGEKLIFATNGGIFSGNHTPLGLYVENGKKLFDLNTQSGDGNFYLKPNGVFLIKNNGTAQIIDTGIYANETNVMYAIQSGPILVSNNAINATFQQDSQNKYIRSGVGMTKEGDIFFAISNTPVTFYEFATFFRDSLSCGNALYLDGAISEMYVPSMREKTHQNFSTILGIVSN